MPRRWPLSSPCRRRRWPKGQALQGPKRPWLQSPPADRWAAIQDLGLARSLLPGRSITHSKFNRADIGGTPILASCRSATICIGVRLGTVGRRFIAALALWCVTSNCKSSGEMATAHRLLRGSDPSQNRPGRGRSTTRCCHSTRPRAGPEHSLHGAGATVQRSAAVKSRIMA